MSHILSLLDHRLLRLAMYDTSPESVETQEDPENPEFRETIETQETRLKPAKAISDASIPCVVWAEDGLSFVHFVPTCLFDLQLIVPDEHVEAACSAITSRLPYTKMDGPCENWLEFRIVDRRQPSCFPNSAYLKRTTPGEEDDPKNVYIHPQSFFSVDVRNYDLSTTLPPPLTDSRIRFLTRTAFLDALIATILDPPIAFRHWRFSCMLDVYISYFLIYTLRAFPRILPSGELESEHKSVLESLKPENRPFFDGRIRRTEEGWVIEGQKRKNFLETAR